MVHDGRQYSLYPQRAVLRPATSMENRAAEGNNTFYQLPEEETLADWRDAVPKDFQFAVKASRYLAHVEKVNDLARAPGRLREMVGRG